MKYYVLRISTDVLFRRDPATTQEAVWKDGEWQDSESLLAGMIISGRTELDEITPEEAKKLENPGTTLTLEELGRVWRYACANSENPFPDNPEAVKQYAEFRKQIAEIPPGTRVMAESTFDWPDAQYDNLLRKGDQDA